MNKLNSKLVMKTGRRQQPAPRRSGSGGNKRVRAMNNGKR